jgi:hypothetical protein
MMGRRQTWILPGVALLFVMGWQAWMMGQQTPGEKGRGLVAKSGRFEFEVIHSFNAKYEGDTPGHVGRSGGLGDQRPRTALGDAVYRGEEKVGVVTGLTWTRAQGSREVEFDPVTKARISVGDAVWLALGEQAAAGGK